MSTRRTADFTQGSIPRHLAQFSLPLLVGNVFQALYNAVDSMWVGRFLGPDALAAVSVGFPVIFALVSLVMGFAMAATVLVSQYSGAGRMDMVRRAAGNSLTMMVVSAVLVSILGVVFNREILGLINTPPEIIGLASGYLNVFFSGMIFMFIYNTAGGILRGLGDSKTPVIYLVYSTVINIVLDPILIFGFGPIPKMGVMGAAVATVIAQAVAAVLTVHYLRRGTKVIDWEPRSFKPDRELTLQTLRIGIPAGMQFTVVSFSALVVGAIVNAFGKTVVAGFGAASRVELFAFFPAMSFGIAVSSLAGQNLGAGREDRVRDIVIWGNVLSGGITLAISAVAVGLPGILLSMFTSDPSVLRVGTEYLRIVGFSYVVFAVMFVLNGVLRGAGDTLPTLVFTIISLWVVRIPLAKVLSASSQLGTRGIWAAIALSPLAGLLLSWAYYATGRWKSKVVAKPSEATDPS